MPLVLIDRLLTIGHMMVDIPANQHIRDLEDLGKLRGHQWVVLPDPDKFLLDGQDVAPNEVLVVEDAVGLDSGAELVFGGGVAAVIAFALPLDENQGLSGVRGRCTCCPF